MNGSRRLPIKTAASASQPFPLARFGTKEEIRIERKLPESPANKPAIPQAAIL